MRKNATKITELIGKTPLLKLENYDKNLGANIYCKLESFNPCSSVKDRIALSMIEEAEKDGRLKKGSTIIEPTSGNTGIGLAMVAAVKGYRLILCMPESMSIERRKILMSLGAEIVLTDAEDGMPGAIEKANMLADEIKDSFMPRQFDNPANPLAHYRTTGPEIFEALDGDIDILVSAVGTGGTISGTGRFVKEKKPDVKVVAVEPAESPVLSGGDMGPHMIQGIGAGFVPAVYDKSVVDEVMTVTSQEAMEASRRLAKREGLLAGISAGANVHAAHVLASMPENRGKNIVTFICDTGERYLSTVLYYQD